MPLLNYGDPRPSPLNRDLTKTIHNVKPSQASPPHRALSVNNKKKNAQKDPSMMMSTTERLKACLKDNCMTDVALVGDDGVPIPAIRCVLGSASPVLKQILYTTSSKRSRYRGSPDDTLCISTSSGTLTTKDEDGFVITLEPQKSRVVHIPGFRGKTINALVEYCCSDSDLHQTTFFKSMFQDPIQPAEGARSLKFSSLIPIDPAQSVIDMLDFAQLAINYEIPKVPQKVVDDFVAPLTKRFPPLACLVMNYLLTVEFAVRPGQPQVNESATSGSWNLSKSDGSLTEESPGFAISNSSQEAKDAEKVISAAAALSKLYTTSLNIIRTQPYAALEPWNRDTATAPPSSASSTSSGYSSSGGIFPGHTAPESVTSESVQSVGGVLVLQAETLSKIVQDTEIECDELFLFKQLVRWHNHHTSHNYPEHHETLHQRHTNESKNTDDVMPQHKINNTLQQMVNGIRTSIDQAAMPSKTDSDEDSFQFQANFNDFLVSNADTRSYSSGKTHLVSENRSSKEESENQWKLITAVRKSKSQPTTVPADSDTFRSMAQSTTCSDDYSCPDPTAVCRELVRHLDLAAIDPVPLKEIVSTAEFVDPKLVMDALWQQATLASRQGGLSFGSIVRGTGGPGLALPGLLSDLTPNKQKKKGPPEHQYYKSHILVQGAGVEECNGIYVQVIMQQTPNNDAVKVQEKPYQQSKTLTGLKTLRDIPTLLSAVSETSETTSSSDYATGPQPPPQTGATQTTPTRTIREIPPGICLRFIKQTKRKQQHKGKTWYLVCRREVIDEDDRCSPVSFQHQWSVIEQDNRDGGQLRVLYEWENDEEARDPWKCDTPMSSRQKASAAAPLVVLDSSSLQTFPERGWSCVRNRYFPPPTCQWFRPRHGSPLLVVPPVKLIERKVPIAHNPRIRPLPPFPRPKSGALLAKTSESLFGLSLLSASGDSESESPKSRRVNITVTRRDEKSRCATTVGNQTSTSSSFQIQKARNRVSLADASLETSARGEDSNGNCIEI
ncbi:expressed unknown protein [Seminavis robusta]|uniref:Uncharacterized protein n=1 Tax=Seminavis robusta TaxID=568900 RepID=A0A9N8ERV1_9STRA|nr:expressed unknown protein [Seminavis robusta]|eukprot:Sro1774_g296790.1 n/a (1009) ;mRNA; f:9678-12704